MSRGRGKKFNGRGSTSDLLQDNAEEVDGSGNQVRSIFCHWNNMIVHINIPYSVFFLPLTCLFQPFTFTYDENHKPPIYPPKDSCKLESLTFHDTTLVMKSREFKDK